ncbi:hypothetical protein V5O48_005657 [Marasmius crinis-equi]|uniref:F-box domain-containing protein n=1 Tax=Marasmius crinis-equi TaxID=585013 RepID=A0ABR3FLT6_9AGAR
MELLGYVFVLHVNFLNQTCMEFAAHQFLVVALVCRHWKIVAYSTPAIWNTPDFMFPTLARNMLHRSKSTPLNIVWTPSCRHERVDRDAQDKVFMEAAKQTSRIASLDLSSASHNVAALFNSTWSTMTGAAPLIHTIRIRCYSSLVDNFDGVIPDEFLAGQAPRLANLCLEGCSLSWRSPLLKNLTTLSIKCPPVALRPQIRVVVDALRSLRSLATLDLRHCISPVSLSDHPSGKILAFPFLQQLVLSVESRPCLSLLQCMWFPDTAAIHLSCWEPLPDLPVNRLFSYVANLMAPAATTPSHPRAIRELALIEEASVTIIARNTNNSNSPSALDTDETPQLRLHVRAHHFGRAATIKSLSGLIPSMHLENLRIDCRDPFPREALVQLLEKSRLLKSLIIQDHISLDFVQLLKTQEAFLPALRTLTLDSVNFGIYPTPDPAPFIQSLKHRSEGGSPLEVLVLVDCTGIYSNDIEEVQKWVDRLSWNGLFLTGKRI